MRNNLLRRLIKHHLRLGTVHRIMAGPLQGMVFRVNEITGRSPWYSGAERSHQRMFKRLVKAGDVVIDVGANWGLHTLYLSRLVGAAGRVIAIEPYPPALAELKWHITANRCANVTLRDLALSDDNGESLFYIGENASTGSLSQDPHPMPRLGALSVRVQTLDQLADDLCLSRLALVKLDVEGAEGRVLEGAAQVIARFHPWFIIDLHTPEQDVLVAHQLASTGYQIERLSGPPIRRTDTGWPDPEGVWGSIVAAPAD